MKYEVGKSAKTKLGMKSLGINYLVNCVKETSYPNSFQLHCLTLDAVNMFRFGERMKDGKCMIITR